MTSLRSLAKAAQFDEIGAIGLHLLGTGLNDAGDSALAESVLRSAQQRHPRDVWVNYTLGTVLETHALRDEAIRFYTAARAIRPDTAHELAHALEKRGDSAEALAVFRDLQQLRPGNARHLGCLGDALKGKGLSRAADETLEAAVVASREAIRRKPDDPFAHFYLGNVLRSQGKLDEAIAEYRAFLRAKPGLSAAHCNLGLALDNQGKPEEAIAEYRTAIRLQPDSAEAHVNLGTALADQGKFDEAVGEFRDAIRLEPNEARAHYNIGLALRNQNKLDEAIAEYREAIRIDPGSANAHYNLGFALNVQGKLDEAIAEWRAAIRIKPDFTDAHGSLGIALASQGKVGEAIAEYRTAIKIKRDDTRAHINLGLALAGQGKLDEAVTEHREAIRIKPDDVAAHVNLGTALADQGKFDEAVGAFRDAIRLKPNEARAHYNIGLALRNQNKLDEAIAEYREAIRIDPGSANAHYNLGFALNVQGKLDEAIAEWRAAIRIKPDLALAHGSLGLALSSQGKLDEAIAEFRTAIRLQPDLALAHRHLGVVLQGQGKLDEAMLEFRRAAELAAPGSPEAQAMPVLIRQLEQQITLVLRLPSILDAKEKPGNPAEGLAFAQMAYDRKHFAAAARLWAEALTSDPKLGDDRQTQPRYNAGCAAALAAAGQGKDEPTPSDAAKARLRQQALDWLKAELTVWTRLLESGPPQARPFIAQTLQHWKEDTDLGGIREAEALAKLPADEQKACAQLWTDAAELLKKASAPPSPASLRQQLPEARKALAKDSPQLAGLLAQIGLGLLEQKKWTEAEPLLRECLAIREKTQPDEWTTFNTRSLLGGSLLGQKKYAEAEPLILSAYEGMKAREANIPPPGKPRFADAAERVVKLYEAWDKKDKAALWRAELAKPSEAPKPQS